jgi:hypothetical protein
MFAPRHSSVVIAVGAALAASGLCAGEAGQAPFLGVVQTAGNKPAILARFAPQTLKPVSRAVKVGEYHQAWSIAPDGLWLAVARGGQGIGIDIVDLKRMTIARQLRTGIAAEALDWVAPRRLVASLQRGGTVVADPWTGQILRRWRAFSFPDASARTPQGLVMLFPRLRPGAPNQPYVRVSGTARLALVNSRSLRSVVLKRVKLSVWSSNGQEYADRAGLIVDGGRGLAYVFAAGALVAEVDLQTMRVSYHRLNPLLSPPTVNGAQHQSSPVAREREVRWAGNQNVAIFGRDLAIGNDRKGGAVAVSPAGVALVNTKKWTWRWLDRSASGAAFAGRRLLVFGPGWDPGLGVGLHAYLLSGRLAYSAFKGSQVRDVEVARGFAYVRIARAVSVMDVASGKVVNRLVPPPSLLDVITG